MLSLCGTMLDTVMVIGVDITIMPPDNFNWVNSIYSSVRFDTFMMDVIWRTIK